MISTPSQTPISPPDADKQNMMDKLKMLKANIDDDKKENTPKFDKKSSNKTSSKRRPRSKSKSKRNLTKKG